MLPTSNVYTIEDVEARGLPFSLFRTLSSIRGRFLRDLAGDNSGVPSIGCVLRGAAGSSFLGGWFGGC